MKTSVSLGAFGVAAAIVLRPQPAGAATDPSLRVPGARLVVPVGSDPSLTWFDIDDDRFDAAQQNFRLDCGQTGGDGLCADDHRAGIDPSENTRQVTMPAEPFDIAVSSRTDAIVTTHQTSGEVSLFLNGWPGPEDPSITLPCPSGAATNPSDHPTLSFVLGGLSTGAAGVASLPTPRIVDKHRDWSFTPGFAVGFRSAAEVDVVRYYDDCTASPSRPFLARTGVTGIAANAGGFDSRGIAIDARPRTDCEAGCEATAATCEGASPGDAAAIAACDAADDQCLIGCAGTPIGVYLANQAPPSLLLGETSAGVGQYGTDDSISFYGQIPLSQGASKVQMGSVFGADRLLHSRVFVVCFDARLIYVFDPESGAVESIVQTGRGPSAMAFESNLDPTTGGAAYAYVAHFTDSYLGVLDLDMNHTSTYLTFVATVAVPNPPREAQ